jgi:hypothetical protein
MHPYRPDPSLTSSPWPPWARLGLLTLMVMPTVLLWLFVPPWLTHGISGSSRVDCEFFYFVGMFFAATWIFSSPSEYGTAPSFYKEHPYLGLLTLAYYPVAVLALISFHAYVVARSFWFWLRRGPA